MKSFFSIIKIYYYKMKLNRKRVFYAVVILLLFSFRYLLINLREYNKPIYQERMVLEQQPKKLTPSIFCIIPTTIDKLDSTATTVYEAWASYCDNHTFVSLIPGKKISPDRGEIKYKNLFYVTKPVNFTKESGDRYDLTTKIYAALKDVFLNHNDYDWYLKADGDTFIFVNNHFKL